MLESCLHLLLFHHDHHFLIFVLTPKKVFSLCPKHFFLLSLLKNISICGLRENDSGWETMPLALIKFWFRQHREGKSDLIKKNEDHQKKERERERESACISTARESHSYIRTLNGKRNVHSQEALRMLMSDRHRSISGANLSRRVFTIMSEDGEFFTPVSDDPAVQTLGRIIGPSYLCLISLVWFKSASLFFLTNVESCFIFSPLISWSSLLPVFLILFGKKCMSFYANDDCLIHLRTFI